MKQIRQVLESGTSLFLNRDATSGIECLPQKSGLDLMEVLKDYIEMITLKFNYIEFKLESES